MQIIIDLDGTICTEEKTYSRSIAKMNKGAKECINKWFGEGHTILIYSARTWMEYEMTVAWLKKHKIKYHQLIMGKPIGDVWIDDRAIQFNDWKTVASTLEKKEKEEMSKDRVYIIAEAGVNHNGSLELAKKMIDVAVKTNVDAIKFQTFIPELVISKYAEKAAYQQETTGKKESQLDMVRKLYLDVDAHKEMMRHCKEAGIEFLSTPFDLDSIDILHDLGLQTIKIPSGEITNVPYLRKMGKLNKKIILSTGMSYLEEVETAINILTGAGTNRNNIRLLHCNTEYPTPMQDVNLRAMITMRDAFKLDVGYSDHTLGIEVPIAAVAMGATIIEKHFTLDKSMEGPDHRASLEPDELKAMVVAIRNIEMALGDGIKKPSPSESKNIEVARKSIVAKRAIKNGELFTEDNITIKRPGSGISAMKWDSVIGKKASRDFIEDELIVL